MIKHILILSICAVLLTACGGSENTIQNNTTTMGQELMDLESSFEKGIITEKEYNRAKKDILKRYDN